MCDTMWYDVLLLYHLAMLMSRSIVIVITRTRGHFLIGPMKTCLELMRGFNQLKNKCLVKKTKGRGGALERDKSEN